MDASAAQHSVDIEQLVSERTATLARHYSNLKALNEIAALPRIDGQQLAAGLNLGRRHLGLDLAIISRIEGERYTVLHHSAPPGTGLKDGDEFELGQTYCSMTLKADDVVAIAHMGASAQAGHPCYKAFGLEAYVGAPVFIHGERFGTVNFSSATPYGRTFDEGDLEFMRLLARWVGSVLERQQADMELARSNAELEQFAYAVSHDLRQPLRAISSYATLLRRRFQADCGEDERKYFDFVEMSVKRMDSMILSLLAYSRVGRAERVVGPVSLAKLFSGLARSFQPLLVEVGADLRIRGDLPEIVGDETELTRLFQNLIDNAFKYREPSRPLVVGIEAAWTGSGWAVTVSDNGMGIAEAHQEKIFGLFCRLHTFDQVPGTGLGLAMCRKLAEMNAATIRVESEPGQGSAFTVSFRA